MIKKSFRYRLYPNTAQAILLNRHLGCARLIYNWALGEKIRTYQESGASVSRHQLQAQLPGVIINIRKGRFIGKFAENPIVQGGDIEQKVYQWEKRKVGA